MSELPKDPVMLLSVVNSKLRDHYPSLSVMCEELHVPETKIVAKLASINYEYDKKTNQFK